MRRDRLTTPFTHARQFTRGASAAAVIAGRPRRQGHPASRRVADAPGHIEGLEPRLLLSGGPAALPAFQTCDAAGSATPAQSSGPMGMTPSQLRHAYAMDEVSFGAVAGDGTGQTIAIVDAYNDPDIVTDFDTFNQTFFPGQPQPTLTVENQQGAVVNPGTITAPGAAGALGTDPAGPGNSWAVEISLDVEWAHVAAPMANILLVEANSPGDPDLYAAVNTARNYSGVCVVSMSWGDGECFVESFRDSQLTTPSGHTGVTFVAASGDTGGVVKYPAASPNVLAVGGTTLKVDSSGNYISESGWSSSGGGLSAYESQPSYQKGVVTQSSMQRAVPDVAADADPNTGVAIADSWDYGASTPWNQIAGTSLTAPLWSGLIAVVDQGLALAGMGTLDGPNQTLPAIYSLPAADFHDVGPAGYDLATGRGTPIANLLVPDLVGVPASATGLAATVVSSNQLNLAWTDHAANATGYYVQQSPDDANWSTIATLGPTATSNDVMGLTPGTYYYFRVLAYNALGSFPTQGLQQLAPLPGDINGDGLIDVADYDIWAANVGATNATWSQGDLNGDRLVDVADYDIWAANVGATASTPLTAASPAPAQSLAQAVARSLTQSAAQPVVPAMAGSASVCSAPPLAQAAWAEFLGSVAAEPTTAPAASICATPQAPPAWAPSERAASLSLAPAGDFDILAHVKPLCAGDNWASTDDKPGDFAVDLLALPASHLDPQLM
jgi:hypothetical protein